MLATLLASIILTVSATALATLGRGSQSLINYTEMNATSRHALDRLGGLLRSASKVHLAQPDRLLIDRITEDGSTESVDFVYDASARTLTVTVNGQSRTLLRDIEQMNFHYYTFRQADTLNPIEVKHVQMEAELTRRIFAITNRNYIISARFMLRNHRVSN